MSSDDSSEDEAISALQLLEASVDQSLLNDSMFKSNDAIQKTPKMDFGHKEPLKSLRPQKEEDQFNELGMSKGFQDYVAKNLEKVIDAKLKKCIFYPDHKKIPDSGKKEKSKVKLLSDSESYIKLGAHEEEKAVVTRKRPLDLEPTEEDLRRCKEAAVDSEVILSKAQVQHWHNRAKDSKLFQYKKNKSGIFEIVEKPFE